MSHTESSLMRLNKEDFVRMLLHYQGMFNNILDELKKVLNELKTKFFKLESDLQISRNANDKLPDKLVALERKCHPNKPYSRRECLEISGIPAKAGDKDIEKKCWMFWMLSTPQFTRIWLGTTIAYPQKAPLKEVF